VQGALQQMFDVFEFMRSHGRRPGPETCYILVKGCVDHGRPDLAELTIKEFEQNGVRVRDGSKLYLEQNRHKAVQQQQQHAAAAAAAAASHPAAAAAAQQAMMGGAAAAAAMATDPR
jgi:pentatricopeptide repeat protein